MCYVDNAIDFYDDPEKQRAKVIKAMQDEVFEINLANGWYDETRTFGDDIALLHSEVSEMFEGYRNHDDNNMNEEAADILIRLLDTCKRHGIDLSNEFRKKCIKNKQRGYKHGGKRL
jgi:NTP pyrophosphatase (non-canonical NTP hydrolase)